MLTFHSRHPALVRPLPLWCDLLGRAGHWPLTVAISIGVAITTAIGVTITLHVTTAVPVRPHAGRAPAKMWEHSPVASSGAPQAGGAGQAGPSVRNPDLSDLRWVGFQGFEVPVSAQAGPRVVVGGLAHGFADTPAGAVLAAANIVTRASWQCGPGVFGPTIEKQVIGDGTMTLLQRDVAAYEQNASRLPGLVYPQIYAYAVDSYGSNDAIVGLVVGAAGSGASMYSVTPVEVQWIDGDWRVVAPSGGSWQGSYIPSPAGYASFPGRQR